MTRPWILLAALAPACAPATPRADEGEPAPGSAETAAAAREEPEPPRSLDSLMPVFDGAGGAQAGLTEAELDLPEPPPSEVRFDAFEREPPDVVPPEPPELEAELLTEFDGRPVRAEERRFANGLLMSRRYVWRDPARSRDVDHGPERRWHPNGILAAWRTWRGGKLDGPALEWAEGGTRLSVRTYVEDVVDGVSIEYDPAGRPSKVQEWRRGVAHGGRWSWWARPLGPHFEDLFEDGVQAGRHRAWSRSGFLIEDGRIEAGERHGPWTFWHDNGVPRSTVAYEHGIEHGPRLEWNKNGVLIELETFAHGVLEGPAIRWSQGVKQRESHYVNGQPDGPLREWWPSGSPKSVITYVAGTPSGPATYWYEGGTKQIEGVMKDGLREGRWTYWKADGSIDRAWTGDYVRDVKVDEDAPPAPPGTGDDAADGPG